MSGLLSGLMSLGRRGDQPMMDYDDAKKRAASDSSGTRRKLAKRANVQPEVLYFLANDADPAVRREIAVNPSTPVQADQILASDADEDVRCCVAEKIARLAPGLSDSDRERAGGIVTEILETLARDQTARIRRALAEELKQAGGVPVSVIERLARDDDEAVCVPVLRASPLLSDDFLVEIIESNPVQSALKAISGREGLGAEVADAIVGTDDTSAITSLLSNKSAQIRKETLDRLVGDAAEVTAWHAPLVARPSLSAMAATALSRFVTDTLLDELLDRDDLDPTVTEAIGENMRRRIGDAQSEVTESDREKVQRLHLDGKLDEVVVKSAVMRGERVFVVEAIASLGRLDTAVVQKAFSLASAKGVAAMAWKAGLSAELAHQMQLRLAKVPPDEAIKPSGGGYAMSDKALDWQVEFFGG
ncbi:MAG: DUF2336 domain-containing protein [Alphaproteobacteria bacterium]